MSDATRAVAEVVDTGRGYEARCLECARTIASGPDYETMREWCRTHRRLVHGARI